MNTVSENNNIVNGHTFKIVSPLASVASFPSNFNVYGQNPGEHVLLFVRESKAILALNMLLLCIVFFLPLFVQYSLITLNSFVLNSFFDLNQLFVSPVWYAIIVLWVSYIIKGFFTTFLKWFYNINILTDQRFLDIDLIDIFHVRVEEAPVYQIQDAKDIQKGLLQSLLHIGNLEILTASESTVFSLSNVPRSSKIRDFIMDAVLIARRKAGNND